MRYPGHRPLVIALALTALLALPLAGLALSRTNTPSPGAATDTAHARATAALAALPLAFEANTGQHDPAVRFLARTRSGILALTPDALALALPAPREPAANAGNSEPRGVRPELPAAPVAPPTLLRFAFAGASNEATLVAEQPLPGIVNYLIGNDPGQWHTEIPTSAGVRYRGLYPGVEVALRGAGSGFAYDLHVAPGADPAAFAFHVEGAEAVRVDTNGELVLTTQHGEVRQGAPVAWQEVGGGVREPVAARFDLRIGGSVGFAVSAYDPALPLVIDPPVYATYLGGGGNDAGYGIAVDSAGAAYVIGTTVSASFPVTGGAPQTTFGGIRDAFVAKLNPSGSAFAYATYLGGGGNDFGNGIAVDGAGAAYVTGETGSANFPVTAGAAQTTYGGSDDAFVAKLNATGTARVYATYLGGSGGDRGNGIAVDGAGAAYVTGSAGTNFPMTSGAAQTTYSGGFVAKLSISGGSPATSTPAPLPATHPPGTPNAAPPRPQPNSLHAVPTTAVPPLGATATPTPLPAPKRRAG